MPHQCVKCGKIYENTAQELLKGCSSCSSHFFFFFKEEDLKLRQEAEQLTRQEREEIVKDIEEVVGPHIEDGPIILDLESVRVKKPGKFEIDLVSLFKRKPIIYKVSEGKYIIDLASTFQMMNAERKAKKD
ncbi:hypothetical protein J4465_02675 [Candidatus Pacearchaeota archaeon]|nr:hypothetical protein [Candidatus Pacearchaeota archaeon]